MNTITYEVTIEIDPAIRSDYLAWLRPHVDEILALPGFLGAQVSEVREPACEDGWIGFCTHYRLRDAAALQAYLRDHAQRLRADGVARFGGRMRASRRVLASI